MSDQQKLRRPSPRLTFDQAIEVHQRLRRGEFVNRIAAHFDVNPGGISEIKKGVLHPGSRAASLSTTNNLKLSSSGWRADMRWGKRLFRNGSARSATCRAEKARGYFLREHRCSNFNGLWPMLAAEFPKVRYFRAQLWTIGR
jgi:hypothetical protein